MHRLILDKQSTSRRYDQDGRLHVDGCKISAAAVNQYYGRELQAAAKDKLDADKVYSIYRTPEALEGAASSFARLPILNRHLEAAEIDPPKEIIAGTIGDNVRYEDGYLVADLTVWDKDAIELIESGDKCELSCGYYFDIDMTAGNADGKEYDGKIISITGNHLALVDTGRAGTNVRIADQLPTQPEDKHMSLLDNIKDALGDKLSDTGGLAEGVDLDEVVEIIAALIKPEAADQEADAPNTRDVNDNQSDNIATDEDDDDKDDTHKAAVAQDRQMVQDAIAAAIQTERAAHKALRDAEALCRPIIGDASLDTADATYKAAMTELGINYQGVHPSAYPHLIKAYTQSPRATAQDDKSVKQADELGLNRFNRA